MSYRSSLGLLSLVAALVQLPTGQANTFIWDPNSPGSIDSTWKRPLPSFANPPVCVPIPSNLTLCYGIKYNDMRIPNLLHHDTLNEVIQQSESWIQLTSLKCHADTQLFLCSLFTPICLDQTIPPCRSLCEDVQKGCEPYMRKHGYSWPGMMRCDQFPLDNNMCIQSQAARPRPNLTPDMNGPTVIFEHDDDANTKPFPPAVSRPKANQTVYTQEEEKFYRRFLDLICKADWVIKSGAVNVRAHQLRVKKYKVIYGNLPAEAPLSLPTNESSNAISTSDSLSNLKRKQKLVIVGVGNGKESALAVQSILSWNSSPAQMKRALKKAKSSDVCRRRNRSSGRASRRAQRNNRKAAAGRPN